MAAMFYRCCDSRPGTAFVNYQQIVNTTDTRSLAPASTSTPRPLALGADVSIATAAYGNAAATRTCLESIFHSATGEFELILIDDCSPDAGAIRSLYLEARQRHANTRIFSFARNLEYSGSLNAILSHARGEWIFFVSNDIFVTPSYLDALLDVARSNPGIGILRGSSNFVDNGLPSHNLHPSQPPQTLDQLFQLGAAVAEKFGHSEQTDPFLVGDAFLVRRAVIDRIGTFDPWFFGYFADQDFGLRAQIAGFQLALVRGAFAYHAQHANFDYLPEKERQLKLDRRWSRVFENWARFKVKYGLPVELTYESIAGLPWQQLASAPFERSRHYCAPADYGQYLI
jgi:GT2 family glycosyltransferase